LALDFVSDEVLAEAAARYGSPAAARVRVPIGAEEMARLRASQRHGRAHDVTFFVRRPDGAVALIRKPSFPPGAFRVPSGGLRPGEALDAGTAREALEETGLPIRLLRYFLRIDATFVAGAVAVPWQSHLVLAASLGETIAPRDRDEIAEARWGTLDELCGPMRELFLATGRGLFRYRVWLHERAAAALAEA
jgi:8-oxo-dGTP pyrophosphatase MutT (NUDIX family)